jgi:hypothetical protein
MRPLGDRGTGRRILPFLLLGFALVGAWLSAVVLLGGDEREPATEKGALPPAREDPDGAGREIPDPDTGAVRGEPVAGPPGCNPRTGRRHRATTPKHHDPDGAV